VRTFRNPDTGETIDTGLALWFPGPSSFTGEDSCELHCHGGSAVITAMLSAIGRIPGTRMAEAGEFTRRAFDAGRIDLTAAEGLGDLIEAETEEQRRQAVLIAGGAVSRRLEEWRAAILSARAAIEAAFDFADEGDVPVGIGREAWSEAADLAVAIRGRLGEANRGEIVRSGFHVVIAGRPNAGKSSLVNALAGRDLAIVAPEAGTTRDVIEARIDIGGYAVRIADTAGIRSTRSTVEREGVRRARERAGIADLVIWLDPEGKGPGSEDLGTGSAEIWVYRSKDDAGRFGDESVSSASGHGLGALTLRIGETIRARLDYGGDFPIARERHRQEMLLCADLLERAARGDGRPDELRAEDLRAAADALGRITGSIGSEDVLAEIFARFCIGK
jgi:tRNA modification GTPase